MREEDPTPVGDDLDPATVEMEDTVYAEYEPQFGQFWVPIVAILVLVLLIIGLIVLFFIVAF
jgi:hypothetical protein